MLHRGIELKTGAQIEYMRAAGLVVARTLQRVRDSAQAGMTTADLDTMARDSLREHGATSNFLHYGAERNVPGFPGVMCVSVNDEIVHGIPGNRVLRDGDVVSVDFGAIVEGWHSDAAITFVVGAADVRTAELLRVTETALWRGIAAARLGGRVSDISHAIGTYIASQGEYGVVREYTGHGIGSSMHQPPDVPNTGRAGRGAKIVPGLVLAVEPIVTLGSGRARIQADDWTVETVDGSIGAHFEHTFTVTESGLWVLSSEDGGAADLAALGLPYGGTP